MLLLKTSVTATIMAVKTWEDCLIDGTLVKSRWSDGVTVEFGVVMLVRSMGDCGY